MFKCSDTTFYGFMNIYICTQNFPRQGIMEKRSLDFLCIQENIGKEGNNPIAQMTYLSAVLPLLPISIVLTVVLPVCFLSALQSTKQQQEVDSTDDSKIQRQPSHLHNGEGFVNCFLLTLCWLKTSNLLQVSTAYKAIRGCCSAAHWLLSMHARASWCTL